MGNTGSPQKILAEVIRKRIAARLPAMRIHAANSRGRAGETKRRGPKGGARGEAGHAFRECPRGAGKHDAFADGEDQESGGDTIIAPAEVFDGEQGGGDDEADRVDRPSGGADLLGFDHGSQHAKYAAE